LSNSSSDINPNPAIPTATQLAETRQKLWHQQGEALLTLENLRSWINAAGFVLFVPRPQIDAPAPTLVEAVLGSSNASPTIAEISEARGLLARLVSEGLAVPLNLLGTNSAAGGDNPDFVVSTAVFSYIFTLRGDKAWKQAPVTSGAVKVSNLALSTFDALTRRGPMTVYDLTTELGKEVTEAAVLRALNELWTHLRVIPANQPDGKPTLWELTSARFLKQIKAGANAGQPSALSALISLYLGQAVVASEDEIETYLSPLAPRSRVRDVVHALLSARQLETVAVEGRTMLHVTGVLPAFSTPPAAVEEASESAGTAEISPEDADGTPRITKYIPKPRKVGTGYLAKAKPAKSVGASPSDRSSGGFKGGFKPRSVPPSDRERRPFQKKTFDRPWEEEKTRRLSAAARPSSIPDSDSNNPEQETRDAASIAAPRTFKPREGAGRSKPTFGNKPSFGSKPSFGNKPSFGSKPGFGNKPAFGSKPPFRSEGRPPRRDFAPRPEREGGDTRPPRKTFSKPGTFSRKREGFGGKPSFDGDSRPPRRDFSPRPPREGGEGRPSFRGERSAGSYSPRPRTDRPQGDRPARAGGSDFAPRKTFKPRSSEGSGFAAKPRFSKDRPAFKPREGQERGSDAETGKRTYRKFDAPRGDRAARPAGSGTDTRKPAGDFAKRKFAGKPGGFAGKKPGFGGKTTGTFAKFSGNKKPFGKKAPARKFKPKEDE
jgi:23S rRNA pseudouridine2605 synthase